MPNVKPYQTTTKLIENVKRRISFPINQSTFSFNDIVDLLNEEIQMNCVPAVRSQHEEFFVFKVMTPLVNGISRYPIPDRAQGMVLRDVAWSDQSGNFYKMSRLAPEDKAYFQLNVGSNQAIGKYYVEGNELVMTPQIQSGATGNLNFFIYLRPNYLVREDRAATIEAYKKDIVIATNPSAGDTITVSIGNQTPSPTSVVLTAVSGAPLTNEFQIGGTTTITAQNLATLITSLSLEGLTTSSASNTVSILYSDLSDTFTTDNSNMTIDNDYVCIKFDQLPTTYTDPDTDETTNLYEVNGLVDFLQTNPGHRTYTYDVKIRQILSGNIAKFKASDLKTYLNNSSGGQLQFLPIKVGDYMCLANECIIPQIPPELHNALAERAASRILMAIGDRDGLAISQQKIAEMDKQQETLIGTRVDGSPPKVFNSFSLLRLGKRNARRRV